MNITINGRVYHVENELELREFCTWYHFRLMIRAELRGE